MKCRSAARAVIAAMLVGSVARAQESQAKRESPPEAAGTDRVFVVVGFRYGNVLGPSGAVGTILELQGGDAADDDGRHAGMLIRPEIWAGGLKLDLGAASYTFTHFPAGGFALSASWLHAWGSAGGRAEPGRDYLGVALELALFVVAFELGGYAPIGYSAQERGVVLTSIGIGF